MAKKCDENPICHETGNDHCARGLSSPQIDKKLPGDRCIDQFADQDHVVDNAAERNRHSSDKQAEQSSCPQASNNNRQPHDQDRNVALKQPARLPKSQSKGLDGRAERVQRDCAPKKLDHDYRAGPALTQH